MTQPVVHVAKGDQRYGFTLGPGVGDSLGQIRIAKVAANGVPVSATGGFGVAAQPGGAAVTHKNQVVVGSSINGLLHPSNGFFKVIHAVILAIKVSMFPV